MAQVPSDKVPPNNNSLPISRYELDDRIYGGSFVERFNPRFEMNNRPGTGNLGAGYLPNPMVKNTEMQSIPEQDRRRRARIGFGIAAKFNKG